jgi:hypothetical protein
MSVLALKFAQAQANNSNASFRISSIAASATFVVTVFGERGVDS